MSRWSRVALWLASLALFVGCYRSRLRPMVEDGGALDAGVRVDAGPRRDSGPLDAGPPFDAGPRDGRYWIPFEVGSAEISLERCEMRSGQTPIFHVRVVANLCDEPGNVRWSIDPATHTVTLDPFVWRPAGIPPCPPATIEIERDVALHGVALEEGEWRVVGPDSTVTFTVYRGPPELTCTDCRGPGEECAIDLECTGARACVAVRGDAACRAVCAAPCQPFPGGADVLDLACTDRIGAATCEVSPDLGWICREATRDLCPSTPCGPGMRCEMDADALSRCVWELSPWTAGGPCVGDDDCLPGLSCVELGGGTRSCRVRCRADHSCPLTTCGPSDVVCEIPKI